VTSGNDLPVGAGAAENPGDLGRLSLNTETTHAWSLPEAVDGAVRAGLSAIGPWRAGVQAMGVDAAARLIASSGLRVSSLCRGGFLTAADDQLIAAALEDNRKAIREAATLGAHELIMVVGGLPAASVPGGPASPYPKGGGADPARDVVAARQRVADRIGDLVPYAQENAVRLALEPLHPMFTADRAVMSTVEQALDLAEPFPSDAVGVVIDTYHVWWDPTLQRQIARAGREGRLASYQICDWVLPLASDPLLSRGHVGDGYVDFAAISGWVAEAGYSGDIEVEIFNEQVWSTPGDVTLATMAQRYREHVLPYL